MRGHGSVHAKDSSPSKGHRPDYNTLIKGESQDESLLLPIRIFVCQFPCNRLV